MSISKITITSVLFLPISLLLTTSALAQSDGLNQIEESTGVLLNIVNVFTIVAVGLAFLYFFWTLGLMLLKPGEGEKGAEQKSKLVYSVIILAVMTSIWGLIGFLRSTFGIEGNIDGDGTTITLPTVESINS